MKKENFIKYLNNDCNESDFEEFVKWVEDYASSKNGKDWAYQVWKTTDGELSPAEEEKYKTILDKTHHRINILNNSGSKGKISGLKRLLPILKYAAAILFLPVLTLLIINVSTKGIFYKSLANSDVDSLEIVAPIGSRAIVQLSDGTEVSLNCGSSIKYPRVFTKDKRGVSLIGEAYFDVESNSKAPFVVKTRNLNIVATGTEFNVQAYSDCDVISTTLVEGIIRVEKNNTVYSNRLAEMKPGHHLEYNSQSDSYSVSSGNIEKYIGWKDGRLIFDNETIENVVRQLGRKYNTNIEIADSSLLHYTYTVTFVDEPLYQILDLMTIATPISYTTKPRKKLPDGTFSKQEIIINRK